jgi:outer membrane protein assembly factor BamB
MQIFCPNDHLIFQKDTCPQCSWKRQVKVAVGSPVWGPLGLGGGLGSYNVFALLVLSSGVVVTYLNNGEIIGLQASSGEILWRKMLPEGCTAQRGLSVDGDRILAAVSDNRPLDQAQHGWLAKIDPMTGEQKRIWEATGHQISTPVVGPDYYVLRVSTPELVKLDKKSYKTIWRSHLRGSWSMKPVIVKDWVIVFDGYMMRQEGYLSAFQLDDGAPVWEESTVGLLDHVPAVGDGQIFYRQSKRNLKCTDIHSGETVWSIDLGRIYSPPLIHNDRLLMVVRRQDEPTNSDHYRLQARSQADGSLIWEAPIPARVRSAPVIEENLILLSDDKGAITGLNLQDGSLLWKYQLGSYEDPVRSEIMPAVGLAVAATMNGKAAAIQTRLNKETGFSTEECLANGDFESAAAIYALDGQFEQAALIYVERFPNTRRALALFEAGKLYDKAGKFAVQTGELSTAEHCYRLTSNIYALAEVLLLRGNKIESAETFLKAGELHRAAHIFEDAGDLRRAYNLYRQAGDIDAHNRLRAKLPVTLEDMEYFIAEGHLKEAAQAAVGLGRYDMAARLYEQIGMPSERLSALQNLVQIRPEEWVWESIAKLARSQGAYEEEALAHEALGYYQPAAEANLRAARQTEQRNPERTDKISCLYEKASAFFQEAGLEEEEQNCRLAVARLNQLPIIDVRGQTDKPFQEGQFNTLTLFIENVGFGVAKNVHIEVNSDRFELIEIPNQDIGRLAPKRTRELTLFLRPLPNNVGEGVPLQLNWNWIDRIEQPYQRCLTTPVPVKKAGENQSGGTPIVIHAQNYYQGAYVAGDQLSDHAHKGDKAEVNVPNSGLKNQLKYVGYCPRCSLPFEEGDMYCDGCSEKVT